MNRLQEILSTMDIPENRKEDLNWLRRNLAFKNGEHKNFFEAIDLIRAEQLKEYRARESR